MSNSCCGEKKPCGCSSGGCCSSCKCGCHSSTCQQGVCSTSHHGHEDGESCCKEFAGKLLCMADQAWMDVLHCKMKEEIERECGAQLEEIARVATTANKARWKHKMLMKKGCSEYSEALAQVFLKEK